MLAQRFAWGEEWVFFVDPQTQQIRSLSLAWTSLALPDPFLVVAAGNTVLRLEDVQQLAQFLQQNQPLHQEDRRIAPREMLLAGVFLMRIMFWE